MHDWSQTILILVSFAGGFAFLMRYIKNETREIKNELKNDMNQLKSELKNDMNQLKGEIKTEISGIRQELNSIATRLGRIEGSLHPFYFPGSLPNERRTNEEKKRKAQ